MMHFRMKLDPNNHDDQSDSLDMFTPCVLRRMTVFIGEVTFGFIDHPLRGIR